MELNRKDLMYIIIVTILTIMTSLIGTYIIQFPITRPDSRHYLQLIEIFQGRALPITATPPFCYRPLLPAIVALFRVNPIYVWNMITFILTILIAPLTYLMLKEFNISGFGAFVGTGLTTVNVMSAAYGMCVVTDVPAIFFLALSLFLIKRGDAPSRIIPVLVIGTLFKEFVILGAAVWAFRALLQKNKNEFLNGIVAGIICTGTYLTVRGVWSLYGVQATWYWQWNNLLNFTENINITMKTFLFGFVFWGPIMFIALIVLWKDSKNMKPKFLWLVYLSPLLLLLFMGLFMAYFSLRFIWPFYFAMAPAGGYAAEWTMNQIAKRVNLLFYAKS